MRTFKHWTLRYIINRIIEKRYRALRPELPWLTPQANAFLDTYLKNTDNGLEFGSGYSTIWFAGKLASLVSVEHNSYWHKKISEQLTEQCIDNVTYHLKPKQPQDGHEGEDSAYVQTLYDIQAESIDFVLVDGIYRSSCTLRALQKLRPGGLLAIDNANIYLPCRSFSPNSRTFSQGPATQHWAEFMKRVEDWRSFKTSNGVSDTFFYFKPIR